MTPTPQEDADGDRIVYRTSRRKALLALVGSGLAVIVSVWLATLGDPTVRIAGWLALAVFGISAAASLWLTITAGPRLIVSDRGIEIARSGKGPILWADVTGLTVRTIESHHFLCLVLKEPQKHLSRADRVGLRLLGKHTNIPDNEYPVPTSGLDAPPEEVYAQIELRLARARNEAAHAARGQEE